MFYCKLCSTSSWVHFSYFTEPSCFLRPSKRVKITVTLCYFSFCFFFEAEQQHFIFLITQLTKKRISEMHVALSGALFFSFFFKALRLVLFSVWHHPMRRVHYLSCLPLWKAGLNHLPDKCCHLSFGHLCYPVGSARIARLPTSHPPLWCKSADAALHLLPIGCWTCPKRGRRGFEVSH